MMYKLSRYGVVMGALLCVGAALPEAQANLIIVGPNSGAPGETLTLSVELDAPLTGIDIDDLKLTLDFDHAVLAGIDSTAGGLLTGTAFLGNAPAGTAVASFAATQHGLPSGVLATWKFTVDSLA